MKNLHSDTAKKPSSGKKSKLPKPAIIALVAIIVLGAGGLTLSKMTQNSEPEHDYQPVAQSTEEVAETGDNKQPTTSPLTGVELSNPKLTNRRITAVMIENSTAARPQSGLAEAGVVFEAIAEGGITRFMALYQEDQPENIGPIRSARPYYVQWAKGFDAAYLHSGGSSEALNLIQSIGINDLDHGKYGSALAQRVSSRYAPHNVYTSMSRVDAVASAAGYTSSDFTPFARLAEGEEGPTPDGKATKVNFDFSGYTYNTSYSYDSKTKLYARSMAGAAHNDAVSGKQIAPRVLIALETSHSTHSNGVHSIYKTVGSGSIKVFQNGQVISGTWRKKSASAPLEILDASGENLPLAAGQTWISVVQPGQVGY